VNAPQVSAAVVPVIDLDGDDDPLINALDVLFDGEDDAVIPVDQVVDVALEPAVLAAIPVLHAEVPYAPADQQLQEEQPLHEQQQLLQEEQLMQQQPLEEAAMHENAFFDDFDEFMVSALFCYALCVSLCECPLLYILLLHAVLAAKDCSTHNLQPIICSVYLLYLLPSAALAFRCSDLVLFYSSPILLCCNWE
jgi:hypothetical protein